MLHLFCDGGVVHVNPSPVGGTWAWVLVFEDEALNQKSGFIAPAQDNVITNNHTEYLAVLEALEYILESPRLYGETEYTIWSDSKITLGRFSLGWRCTNIPDEWLAQTDWLFDKIKSMDVHLHWQYVKGHVVKRKQQWEHRWNSYVDDLCKKQAVRERD